jgi:hypothetical protein
MVVREATAASPRAAPGWLPSSIARPAGLVCLAGAAAQVLYGLLAVRFPYPATTGSGFEALWAVANVGMIGGVVGLLALDAGRPRRLALVGGGIAILGNLLRIGAASMDVADPSKSVDALIVASVPLMFVGMAVLSATILRGERLLGWQKWIPALVTTAAAVAAAFYSIDKVVHFILLGLLWGAGWLAIGYLVVRRASASSQRG